MNMHEMSCINGRQVLLDFINGQVPNFAHLNDESKFIYLMTCEQESILKELAKFVFISFKNRPQ